MMQPQPPADQSRTSLSMQQVGIAQHSWPSARLPSDTERQLEMITLPAGRALGSRRRAPFTGVSRSGARGRWRAQLCAAGKIVHLGTFETEEDAARSWDRAAIAVRGRSAQTNFDINEYLDGSHGKGSASGETPLRNLEPHRARSPGSAIGQCPSSLAQTASDLSGDETAAEDEDLDKRDCGAAHVGAKAKRGRCSIDFLLNDDQPSTRERSSKRPAGAPAAPSAGSPTRVQPAQAPMPAVVSASPVSRATLAPSRTGSSPSPSTVSTAHKAFWQGFGQGQLACQGAGNACCIVGMPLTGLVAMPVAMPVAPPARPPAAPLILPLPQSLGAGGSTLQRLFMAYAQSNVLGTRKWV